jgi:5'-nucleotidase
MPSLPLRIPLALLGATALLVGPFVVPASAAPVSVQVVAISDFHGRLEPIDETETDPPQPIGGAVQLAAAVDALTAENPDTVFASAGDNIGASTFTSNVQQDAPTLEVLDQAGLAVSAVGNHEFDRGFADIARGGRVDDLADFPYLGANVYRAGADEPVLDATSVEETPSGVSVGFVGVVTQETASLVNPAGIAGLEFGDEAEAANREAARLRDGDAANGEADVVVLLLHDGSEGGDCAGDATLQALSDDVDAVVAGHTHESYVCNAFTGRGGFAGPVVQAGEYGSAVGVLSLTVDDVTGEVSAATAAVRALTGLATTGPRATAVATTVDDAVEVAQVEGAVPLGQITGDITRAVAADGTEDRGAESALGNFVADVQLDQTRTAGAQIAFMNPGGIRGNLDAGDITHGEAFGVQPFSNIVTTKTMTGSQIELLLEQQFTVSATGALRSSPTILQVSEGFTYAWDPDGPAGDRVDPASIQLNGVTLDPATSYRVTMNNFLGGGGDDFPAFTLGTNEVTGADDLVALEAYLGANDPYAPADLSDEANWRITLVE